MNIFVIGINHKTAPVSIREKFFLRSEERQLLLLQLKNDPCVAEAFILSTCNRTEIYIHLIHSDPSTVLQLLFCQKAVHLTDHFRSCFYIKSGDDALRHLFHVSCGLDSLVIGEKQILGQLKEAADMAGRTGMLEKTFNILTNFAIRTGKLAQTNTRISFGGSSVSWAAVAMAQKLLGSLQNTKVLIIGAGKMSQLTSNQLTRKLVGEIYVMNRTLEKAQDLAEKIGGEAISFTDIKSTLSKIDVCICSAGAPHYLIDRDLMAQTMSLRGQKPILLIDISTPRNIDPDVLLIPRVQLISIDDLQKVVDDNMEQRRQAIVEVENIINKKIAGFYEKFSAEQQLELV